MEAGKDHAGIHVGLAVIVVLFAGLLLYTQRIGVSHEEAAAVTASQALYSNYAYDVSFAYPSDWQPAAGSEYTRYEGPTGFFSLSAAGTTTDTIDLVVSKEVERAPSSYGTAPITEIVAADNERARLILSSASSTVPKIAALVVQYPEPVVISGEPYPYLIISGDEAHIKEIAASFSFINQTQPIQ